MTNPPTQQKSAQAYRTIAEVAEFLSVPQHVLRFWETRFSQIKPLKRAGGRRFYTPDDVSLLAGIQHFLYREGYTIKGVQRILKTEGVQAVRDCLTVYPQSTAAETKATPKTLRKSNPDVINLQADNNIKQIVSDKVTSDAGVKPTANIGTLQTAPEHQLTAQDLQELDTFRIHLVRRLHTALQELSACQRSLATVRSASLHTDRIAG
jgi:DNA-binding transcriptional MerR regulator